MLNRVQRVDPLAVDLYELTMVQAYLAEGMVAPATFSLHVRSLPARRNYLVACGLDEVLRGIESLRFDTRELAQVPGLTTELREWLVRFRFSGEVRAVPEGTPLFAGEPLLEVTAPLPEAQLLESWVLSAVHYATAVASRASRMVAAARGRSLVEFGLRRAPSPEAHARAVRAACIAGFSATSNVAAARALGVPAVGTMAHSYVQAHDDEVQAFAAFARLNPGGVLLVDTYDTLAGIEHAVALARALPRERRPSGLRIDSGDLAALAHEARARLDAAGLRELRVVASGGLDEDRIDQLRDAPIDTFGVGTSLVTIDDAPALDLAYKLVSYAGRDRVKRSPGKVLLPGAKQVWRRQAGDLLTRAGEAAGGTPLLVTVMIEGRRVDAAPPSIRDIHLYNVGALSELPAPVRGLTAANPPYPVEIAPGLTVGMRSW
jgi:nicotinate phosphoribosyltransferase